VTAGLLEDRGIRPDFVPESFTAESLAENMDRGVGRVLLPRVESGPAEILDLLKNAGWTPEECITYVNVLGSPSHPGVERVRGGSFDVVTFASASAVQAFVELVGEAGDLGLGSGSERGLFNVACIGPQTAAAATEAGFRVDIVASEHTGGGLRDALIAHFSSASEEVVESGNDTDRTDESVAEVARHDDGRMGP
jgi:uroporphyrinogen-III synthase